MTTPNIRSWATGKMVVDNFDTWEDAYEEARKREYEDYLIKNDTLIASGKTYEEYFEDVKEKLKRI